MSRRTCLAVIAFVLLLVCGCNDPPEASFTFSPPTGSVPLKVVFDASMSRDPDGSVVSYEWDFGDGQTGSGMVVEHEYADAGTFIAKLTVKDNDGEVDHRSEKLIVYSPSLTQRVILTPQGGRMELDHGVVLEVPSGAVDAPAEIQLRMLQGGEINRGLYTQNVINRHWTGREIDGTVFNGHLPLLFVAGVSIEPTQFELRRPIFITLRSFHRPSMPAHVLINPSGELEKYFSTPIDVAPLGPVEIPGTGESFQTYSVTFNIERFSTHAIIDYDRAELEEISECDVPETACRCGRIRVERGEHDYSNEECTLSQSVVRVRFLDCPGQPVEEYEEVITTEGCEDKEPIPDLLNYRPGKKWAFSLSRVQLTPDDRQWDFGNHKVRIDINAEIEILPAMNPEGEQSLGGSVSGIVDWEILPATTEHHDCGGARSVPLSLAVDFQGGSMNWDSPSDPPSMHFGFVINSEGMPREVDYGIIQCRSLGPEPGFFEKEIGIAYVRTYGFGAVPFVPFLGTWEYPSGLRTPDKPTWFLLMLSYPSFSSTENVSLAPLAE